ncbi:hypothetical protein PRZ48_009646 [Zasmidium cellare]|uniref:Uncharacterized protein n=1 Tax=Zasmidium cellare TaxID=395010 RepID=A0ABR0ECA1_ZASCE|nr:hypothetical protein PRZ48_009646 [Zasmidium cellare]
MSQNPKSTMLFNRLTKSLAVRLRRPSSATCQELPVPETPGNALREAFDAGSGEASAATVPIPIDRLQRIESHVENLTQMMQTLQARSGRASRSGVGSRGSSASRAAGAPTPSNVSDLGLSRVSTSQSSEQGVDFRYVDLASLTTLCDEVAELGDVLSHQARFLLNSAQASPVETPGRMELPTERPQQPERPRQPSRPTVQGPYGTQRVNIPRSMSEPTAGTEATSGIDPIMDYEMNPPNIDWAYLDQVLRGNEDTDDGPGPSGERRP